MSEILDAFWCADGVWRVPNLDEVVEEDDQYVCVDWHGNFSTVIDVDKQGWTTASDVINANYADLEAFFQKAAQQSWEKVVKDILGSDS